MMDRRHAGRREGVAGGLEALESALLVQPRAAWEVWRWISLRSIHPTGSIVRHGRSGVGTGLDEAGRAPETLGMDPLPARRPSASAPARTTPDLGSPRERLLRALALGQRAQYLRQLGDHARSRAIDRPR